MLIMVVMLCVQCTDQPLVKEKERTLIDFFLPLGAKAPLASEGIWGDKNILPRDTTNGLEGKSILNPETGKYHVKDWCYWDGSIIKDEEGKYPVVILHSPYLVPSILV